jgi:CRISPR system Cascade subunit CasB
MSQYQMLYRDNDQDKLKLWWKGLDDNRGERAVLRRAASADDVLLTPAFARFLKVMPAAWSKDYRLFDSAMVAGLLARVKSHEGKHSFAKSLAMPKKDGSKSVMSELRFQQLQKSRDVDEFYRRMTRALTMLDGKTDLLSVADGILLWSKERRQSIDKNPSKRLAVCWAKDYYTFLKD